MVRNHVERSRLIRLPHAEYGSWCWQLHDQVLRRGPRETIGRRCAFSLSAIGDACYEWITRFLHLTVKFISADAIPCTFWLQHAWYFRLQEKTSYSYCCHRQLVIISAWTSSRLAFIYIRLVVPACQHHWTAIQRQNPQSFPAITDFKNMVGGNELSVGKIVCCGSRFPSKNVCCRCSILFREISQRSNGAL